MRENPTVPKSLSVGHIVKTDFWKWKIIKDDNSLNIFSILLEDGTIQGLPKVNIKHIKDKTTTIPISKRLESAMFDGEDYTDYTLPDQNNLPILSKEDVENGRYYIIRSQAQQNESDNLSNALSTDYVEDIYRIIQWDKTFLFKGTYGWDPKEWEIKWRSKDNKLSLDNYLKKHKDAIYLGIWTHEKSVDLE